MRHFFGLVLLSILLSSLPAAPIGNTAAPALIQRGFFSSSRDWVDVRAGYEGDFVADAKMEQRIQGQGRVDTYEEWIQAGTLTLNFLDRLDLYGVFGMSQTEADWRFEDMSLGTVTRIEVKTDDHFLWAIGGRAVLYQWYKVCLGMGARYSSCCYLPSSLHSNGETQTVGGSRFDWRQWQINLDFSYKINLFTPYIGVKYLRATTDLQDFSVPISESLQGVNTFENRTPVGFYLGCTLSTGKYFMLNLEARLVDEEAVTVSGDFRF